MKNTNAENINKFWNENIRESKVAIFKCNVVSRWAETEFNSPGRSESWALEAETPTGSKHKFTRQRATRKQVTLHPSDRGGSYGNVTKNQKSMQHLALKNI